MGDGENELLTQYSQAPLDEDELLRMAEANPDNINILDCLAFKFYTSEQLDRALEFYKKIVTLDDQNESAHFYIGNIFYRKKQIMAAIFEWKKVIGLGTDPKLADKAQERIDAAMKQIQSL